MTAHTLARNKLFLQNLDMIIEAHISDADFDVKKLLRASGTSRTDMHRKLACSVGMSTTEYLRYKRLMRAAKLLLAHPDWSVCQIAFEAGFQSHSYFTMRFREVFGISPLAYKGEEVIMEHL